jgi:hypothetical protein
VSTLTFDVPPDQWTPEYAAQIQAILQQSQEQNPWAPGTNEPGIVPMGAPGGLTPPPMAPLMEAPPDMAPMPQAPPEGGGGGIRGFLSNIGQSIPQGLGQALGMGALGFLGGIQPGALGARNIQTVMGVGQQVQQQAGQRQLAEIRSNIAKLGQEKGSDAVKKYLTEAVAAPNLNANVSKVVAEELKTVTDRTNARDAVTKLSSRDPKVVIAALPGLIEAMGPDKAMAIYNGIKQENKPQVVQAGDQIWTFDPATREFAEGPKATPKFNAATIGGTDVTEELRRMKIDPTKATEDELQTAAMNVEAKRDEDRAKGRASHEKAILGGAALQAKAIEQSTLAGARETGKNMAEIASAPAKREQAEKVRAMLGVEDNINKLSTEFTPQERAQYVGMGGLKMGYNQALQLVQSGKADQKFARFSALVNEGKGEAFQTAGKAFTASEKPIVFGYIPTGEEWSSEQFEQKLKLSHERIGTAIDREADLGATPAGSMKDYVAEQRGKRPKVGQSPKGRVIQR